MEKKILNNFIRLNGYKLTIETEEGINIQMHFFRIYYKCKLLLMECETPHHLIIFPVFKNLTLDVYILYIS